MASRRFVNSLQKGQILRAKIEEVNSPVEVLCNFQGELLLVTNHTGQNLKRQDPIFLQVAGLNPLRFQIFDPQTSRFQRVV